MFFKSLHKWISHIPVHPSVRSKLSWTSFRNLYLSQSEHLDPFRHFLIPYVPPSATARNPDILLASLTERLFLLIGEFRSIAKNPFPAVSFPVMIFLIPHENVFKVGSSIKSSCGKREMPLRKNAFTGIQSDFKSSEWNQGSEQVFAPLSKIGDVGENLWQTWLSSD